MEKTSKTIRWLFYFSARVHGWIERAAKNSRRFVETVFALNYRWRIEIALLAHVHVHAHVIFFRIQLLTHEKNCHPKT